MSDPVTIGLMIASTAASVGGAIYSANAAKVGADYDASVSEANADRADVTAAQLVAENARRAVDFRADYSDFARSQEVARTKQGVYAYSGTALEVAMASAREADDELARQADIVLIDTPPVLPVADTLVIGRLAAGAVLVVEANETSVDLLNRTKSSLTRNQTRILGVVLNKLRGGAREGYEFGYGEAATE